MGNGEEGLYHGQRGEDQEDRSSCAQLAIKRGVAAQHLVAAAEQLDEALSAALADRCG